MNKALSDYYEARFSMMYSKGWNDLIDDATEIIKTINSIETVVDHNDLLRKQGELRILQWLCNLKRVSEVAFEELKVEDANNV